MLNAVRRPLRSRKSRIIGTLGQLGRWTLVMVVLCLAFIGLLHLTRGTAVRHVRGVATDGIPISAEIEPEFPPDWPQFGLRGAWFAHGQSRVEVMFGRTRPIFPLLCLGRDLFCRDQRTAVQITLPAGCVPARRVAWPMCSVKYFVNDATDSSRTVGIIRSSATPSVPVLTSRPAAFPG